jgi:hypothetical protein
MPEQVHQTDRPELGFVSLGQYLGANQGTLDQQYGQDASASKQFTGYDDLYKAARSMGYTNPGASPQSVEGYQSALDQASKAQELGRTFNGESGLAGSGRYGDPLSSGAFNAGLLWAAHGPQYQQLSGYLTDQGPQAASTAAQSGLAQGAADRYAAHHPTRTNGVKPSPAQPLRIPGRGFFQ